MHQGTSNRMLAIKVKKLTKFKTLIAHLNNLSESNVVSSFLDLKESCAIYCSCKTIFNNVEEKSESNSNGQEYLQIFLYFDEVLIKYLEIELDCFDNSSILKAITLFLGTNSERPLSLNAIRKSYVVSIDGKSKFDILLEHAGTLHKIKNWFIKPWICINLCNTLTQQSSYEKILRNALAYGTHQANIRQTFKNAKTSAALQAILKSHGDLSLNKQQMVLTDFTLKKLSEIDTFEDLLSSIELALQSKKAGKEIKHILAPAVSSVRIMAYGYFSKLTNIKKRCKIDALASYHLKFTHLAGILMPTPHPTRLLETGFGRLSRDTVIAGKRKKHFSQAFMGYLSPGYSEKYTYNCSKSASITGALDVIKNYIRKRKEEYYSKKAASTKKRRAHQIEQTYDTLANSNNVFEKAGYGFYCF